MFLLHYDHVVLIDTEEQLRRLQVLGGLRTTVRKFVKQLRLPRGKRVLVVGAPQFARLRLGLDVVFNVATMDVVLPEARKSMIRDAHRNLRKGGRYALVVPRNDTSILRRCSATNRYQDGHAFSHHGVHTFYRNFTSQHELIDCAVAAGFELEADLSRHKQIGLLFRR